MNARTCSTSQPALILHVHLTAVHNIPHLFMAFLTTRRVPVLISAAVVITILRIRIGIWIIRRALHLRGILRSTVIFLESAAHIHVNKRRHSFAVTKCLASH